MKRLRAFIDGSCNIRVMLRAHDVRERADRRKRSLRSSVTGQISLTPAYAARERSKSPQWHQEGATVALLAFLASRPKGLSWSRLG